jgi:CBS-domain-containing membrane protein
MHRDHYDSLPQLRLAGTHCEIASPRQEGHARLDSAAVEVMTDLRRIPAANIAANTRLPEANQIMILRGVRMLFVTDSASRVLGLITTADLLGEKPMKVGRALEIPFAELAVHHVMTPLEAMEAVSIADLSRARVGHVVSTLKRAGRQHALVLEQGPNGEAIIRGILSSSQIARQLGIALNTTEVARTFAEIEAAIA